MKTNNDNGMIAIVDYNAGNLRNVQKAFEFHGCGAQITNSPRDIVNAKAIVLPGVGHFKHGMENLEKFEIVDIIKNEVLSNKKPILGICLGMQLFSDYGYEGGKTEGLGLLRMETVEFPVMSQYRIPHIGWNSVKVLKDNTLFSNINSGADFYFVHSYVVRASNPSVVSSTCMYGTEFVSSIELENIFATQFHPEKSQRYGRIIIKNFINMVKGL